MESNSISNRERKLFTLNSIYHATQKLLDKKNRDGVSPEDQRRATEFWTEVGANMPEWVAAAKGDTVPADLRQQRIHSHGIALLAIGTAGNSLLAENPKTWKRHLAKLATLDWSRSNLVLWEGRAMSGGVMCKAGNHAVLTSNVIKQTLALSLSEVERKVEDAHEASRRQQSDRPKAVNSHKGKARRAARENSRTIPRRRPAMGNRVQRR